MVGSFILLAVIMVLYFIPSIVAYSRHTGNRAAVLVIDFFLGWTFLGWVVALAMAAGSKPEYD